MARRDAADQRMTGRVQSANRALDGAISLLRLVVVGAVLTGLAAGCANVERSRDTANPNVAGATLAMQVCSNCHGPTGNSVSPNFPNLAQQQQAYLDAHMLAIKDPSREEPAGHE